MKNKALSIVVLLLTVVLFGLLFVNHRQEQRQTAYMQQLQKEAMPYELEINDIRLELAQKQRAINIEEDTSGILFGFVPASADDFTEIDKLAAEHSITPVILLDCSQEKEQLAQILEKAVAKDYEVVLAGLQIDESILQTADEMKDLLAQMDDTKSPAFLLRNNVNTEETRNLLNEHTAYGAVELERELKKKTGNMRGAIMPVVFTSGLGVEQWNEGKWLGKLNYNISQTPQVWLDHQVVEMDGCLCLFWDSVDELFYPGMLDEMFRAYTGLLHTLAVHPEIMQEKTASLVTAEISEKRRQANETAAEFEEKTLDGLFLEAADKSPDKEALVTCSRRMTYREIKEEAFYISGQLKSMGIKKEETVAVFMEKGWEQVVAVYGILFAGAAYLPIDIHNPRERVEKILRDSGTRIILVQNQAYDQDTEWLHEWDCISVSGLKTDSEYKAQENKAGDLAYVIYTSGTTGMPKGVMITHHNAVNTILDINARYQITEQDTAFGISNLHFDLSVYDVFGVLGAGGKLVLPDPEYGKDPAHWIHWLNHENITVWNSVPAFVEMLAEYEEYQRQVTSQSLRLVMMSGDWVPVSLPGRIRNLFQNVEIVALGGATEGSIWSNHFEIPEIVPEDWKSIPYGKPLANQKYYVLDQNMEDCPDWVPGTLYIAGDGVAQGYLNDNEKTEEKFVVLDRTGERLYCTGDMGRYWNEGNIEFLGRLDNQVKINGYRVELGEIEAALRRIQGITEAFVFFKRDNAIEDICAVLVEEKRYRDRIDKFYKEMLKKDLPIYMIPTEYIKTNAIPLNSNGKKDIHKILIVAEKNRKPIFKKNNNCKQLTQLQEQLLAIWREVLKIENIDINDNFFEIGGNSIQAIQITNQMTEKIGCFMDIGKLFEYPTISKIERYILEET